MERNHFDNLGAILKNARINNNLTREQLAEKISITPRYLMSIENENKKPSYDVLFRLIRELCISADTIFFPENSTTITEVEQLTRLLRLCNERDLKIAAATIKAILDTK